MITISAPAPEISSIGPNPVRDAVVSIRPEWLRDEDITLRMPEIIYSRSQRDTYYIDHVAGGGFVALRERYVHVGPVWEILQPGRHLRYRVSVPGKCSFCAELAAGEDVVHLTWGFRNETGRRIDDLMVQFCPCMDRAEAFVDPKGERVYLPCGDAWLRACEREGYVPGHPNLHRPTESPGDDVICLESRDGRRVVGIGWDVRPQHFLNNSFLSCVHTEPHIDPLEPGAEQEVHGAFYCMEGDRKDLVGRFRREWRRTRR